MDDSGPQISIPDESVITSDSNFSPPPSVLTDDTQNPSPNLSGNKTAISKNKDQKASKVIVTIFGIMLLIGSVGAGLILISQRQLLNQNAQIVLTANCVDSGTNGACTISGANPDNYYVKKCTCVSNSGTCSSSCVNVGVSTAVTTPECGSVQIDIVNSGGRRVLLSNATTELVYRSDKSCTNK